MIMTRALDLHFDSTQSLHAQNFTAHVGTLSNDYPLVQNPGYVTGIC